MFETGVGLKNPLFFIGCVENIGDGRKEGRVQVRAFNVHGTKDQIPTEFLPWAQVCYGNYDPNTRLALNDWVFGVFLDGREAQQPMVLGLIPTQMTEAPNPETDGHGTIPAGECDVQLGPNAGPQAGQPRNSRLHRGEEIHNTYVPVQEMMRKEDIEGAKGSETWSEPPPAYDAKYPYNRVIETAKHSIEIDDTPGAERIMVRHNSGSYIQIDEVGSHTHKTTGDKFEVNDNNQYVYVNGCSNVTINGNAYVKVNGDKVEEIDGNLQQLVHGNYLLSVGGEANIVGSEGINMRAVDIRAEANQGELHLFAYKNMKLSTSQSVKDGQYGTMHFGSDKISAQAFDKMHLRGETQVNIQSIAEMNLSSVKMKNFSVTNDSIATNHKITSTVATDITSTVATYIGSTSTLNLNAPFVNADSIISLANGDAGAATASTIAADFLKLPVSKPFQPASPIPELAIRADTLNGVVPAPVDRRTAVQPVECKPAEFSGGILSVDEEEPE